MKITVHVRSLKLSIVLPGQYLDGGPPRICQLVGVVDGFVCLSGTRAFSIQNNFFFMCWQYYFQTFIVQNLHSQIYSVIAHLTANFF